MSDSPETLYQKFLAEELSEEEAAKLHALLEADPNATDRLIGHLHLDSMLRELAKSGDLPMPSDVVPFPAPQAAGKRSWSTVIGWTTAAAAVAVLATFALMKSRRDVVVPARTEETSAAVALISRSVDAVWEGAEPNSLIEPGWLKLRSGVVQIDFFSGAQVAIEGPAEFQLISPSEAYCPKGRLSAEVPPQAKGFRIGTPKGTIVDLGTAFGLNIGEGEAQVQVFQGEVELHESATDKPRSLTEGQAMAVKATGNWQPTQPDHEPFSAMQSASLRADAFRQERTLAWEQAGQSWNADPSMLVRFDFTRNPGRRLVNVSQSKGVADATIIGSTWTTGRWPGKSALAFHNLADRARLVIPGTLDSFTLGAWIRVDGLGRKYNSLFMSEGWSEGSIHWQILDTGAIRLGLHGTATAATVDLDSPVIFTSQRLGVWTYVAVVVDQSTNQVTHFVNRESVNSFPLGPQRVFRPATAELGNWNTANRKDPTPIRQFTGAMDEFILLNRAAAPEEIHNFHQLGKP
jgi:hypothetical protein